MTYLHAMAATSVGNAAWEQQLMKKNNDPASKSPFYCSDKCLALRQELPGFEAAVIVVVPTNKVAFKVARKTENETLRNYMQWKAAEKKKEIEASYQVQAMATTKVSKMDAGTATAVNAQIVALNKKKRAALSTLRREEVMSLGHTPLRLAAPGVSRTGLTMLSDFLSTSAT